MSNSPLIVEFAAIFSPPPVMSRGSSIVTLLTDSTFELIVTVTPGTLIVTSSPTPGTASVLQLLAVSHGPLVVDVQETSVASSRRDSSDSKRGRKAGRKRNMRGCARPSPVVHGAYSPCRSSVVCSTSIQYKNRALNLDVADRTPGVRTV